MAIFQAAARADSGKSQALDNLKEEADGALSETRQIHRILLSATNPTPAYNGTYGRSLGLGLAAHIAGYGRLHPFPIRGLGMCCCSTWLHFDGRGGYRTDEVISRRIVI